MSDAFVLVDALLTGTRAKRRSNDALGVVASLRTAVDLLERDSSPADPTQVSEIVRFAAEAYAQLGRPSEGIALCRRLELFTKDIASIDVLLGLGALYRNCGLIDVAEDFTGRALSVAVQLENLPRQLRILNNRGVLRLDKFDYVGARDDFTEAHELAVLCGDDFEQASCLHNLGVAFGRLGKINTALELFESSAAVFEVSGNAYALLEALLDRVELLVDVGLLAEARSAAQLSSEAHLRFSAQRGLESSLALQTRIEVADGKWTRAVEFARQLVETLRASSSADSGSIEESQHRLDLLELVAGAPKQPYEGIEPDRPIDGASAVEIARAMLDLGRVQEARNLFEYARTAKIPGAFVELHRILSDAQIAELDGHRADLFSAIERGLRVFENEVLCLGSSDLRRLAIRRLEQISEIGIRTAIRDGSIEAAANLIDRLRILSLHPEPSTIHAGRTYKQLRQPKNMRGSVEEQLLRDRRHLPGTPFTMSTSAPRTRQVLYLHDVDGEMFALQVGSVNSIVRLGPAASLRRRARAITLILHAIANRAAHPSGCLSLATGIQDLFRSTNLLDDSQELTIISNPSLPTLPWALLTSRPVSFAQSALHLSDPPVEIPSAATLHFVEGPGLDHSTAEHKQVSRSWGNVKHLGGSAATVDATIESFQSAELFHLSAHGTFRADAPLFSELLLNDGYLTLFELLRGGSAPKHVVFAACDFGRDSVASSLGAFALLRGLGCGTMLASYGPLRDESIGSLMFNYYQELKMGTSPSAALAISRRELIDEDPSLAMLNCFSA